MFARTERTLLRPGWIEDAPALHAALSDEAVVRNLARAPWPYAIDDARAFLERPHSVREPSFLIMLRTGARPRLIGGVGLGACEDGEATEIGYWIARPYWGLGFASEAARAVVDIARALKLPRLVGAHMIDNPASGAVLRKIGFVPTGRIAPRYSAGRGREVATVEYAEEEVSRDAMRGGQTILTELDDDPRREIRLLAA